MIPAPAPSTISWAASPDQRARWAQSAAAMPRVKCKPFTSAKRAPVELPPGENLSEAAKQSPKLGDHWFVSKPGRTMSDSAIRLLRLKGWLDICLADKNLESEVYTTECRLREQAAYIIGWCA